MISSGLSSVRFGRPFVVASAFSLLAGLSTIAQAQTPAPAAAPAAAQDASKPDPRLVGSGTHTIVLIFVKPDKTADFEAVMGKLKEAIATPDKPDDPAATPDAAKAAADLKAKKAKYRKMAEGWTVTKIAEPMGGNATYLWELNPSIDGADYNPTAILYDNLPYDDAQVWFGKLGAALAGIQKWTATKVLDMKSGG